MDNVDEVSLPTFRAALTVLPFPVAILDSDGIIVQTNEQWEECVAGTSNPIATGGAGDEYVTALVTAADRTAAAAEVIDGVRSLLDGSAETFSTEYTVDQTDPEQRVLLRAKRFETDGERFTVLSCFDVTDQKTGSSELRLKERAMDEAPVGITISDPDTEDNVIVYANEAFERITGYSTDAVIGRNCRFLQGAETSEEPIQAMRTAVENEESIVTEIRNYRKNGEQFWNEVSIAPIYDEDGELQNFVGFQRDVTARKNAQVELNIERDRLALLNQLIRHDIRNDMAVILGWGKQLREQIPDEQQDDLQRILTTARHTKQLTESVRDLLDIFDEDDPELSSMQLDNILRDEIERVRSTFEYRAQTVTIEIDESLPAVQVQATSLLSSVFGNVLDNAIFHNDKPAVEIEVSVEQRESTVVVRIADNGPGIPDDRKRDVFGRGDKGLESPGTGLGLYLVDHVVSTYGGSVWVEDNDPEGAVFAIELERA